MEKILEACDKFGTKGKYGAKSGARVKAFVLVMRYTGLRIGDCVSLGKENVKDGKVFLETAKTGVKIFVPVPDLVLDALKEIEGLTKRYFWNEGGTLLSAVSVWQRTLNKLFKAAGIFQGHSHRLRDTFSISLLERGVSIENVAKLLGHQNILITQRHYAAHVQSTQLILEEAVRRTW